MEHMIELKNAGYRAVGLQEICDLYNADKLLPERAVVILLDSHRDTRLNAMPIIKKLGLRASVMLNLGAIRQGSRSFISWHDLRKMRWDRHWDFGITAAGADDLREQSDYLESHLSDIRVCGVIAPTGLGNSVMLSKDKTVFFSPVVGDGYNSIDSDPSCLSLLQLTPRQGGRELVGMLSGISSQKPRIDDRFTESAMRANWFSTCGQARVADDMLEMYCGSTIKSANAWSSGTHDWSDIDLAVEFQVTGGRQFWAYARFSSADSFIRLGCDGRRVYLQHKVPGSKAKNLKVGEPDCDFSRFHTLRLIVRGRCVIPYLDGHKLSERPLRVDDSLVSGRVGYAIWDPSPGVAGCRIRRSSIRKLPCMALMNTDWHKGSTDWAAEHSDYLSYLCPKGLSLDASSLGRDKDDFNALLISSAYSGHTLAPTVVLNKDDLELTDSDAVIDKLTDLIESHSLKGMHLDCRTWHGERSSVELVEMLTALKEGLPESTLILSLSPQHYQTCDRLLELADVLVLGLEDSQCDLLNDIARPFRLKTLLRIESGEPWTLLGRFGSAQNGRAADDSTGDAGYIAQKYELKGFALCKR